MLIYVIRHGVTDYNAQKRYQGSSDIPLSAAGRRELRQADFAPVRVYVSPLLRAKETAEILFPGAELVPVPGLREMDFGIFEGRTYAELEENADYRRWVDGGCVERCPGGEEDKATFTERCCAAFAQLVDAALESGEERLVIVAHGGTQRASLSRHGRPERDYFDWQSGNGRGYVLDADRWSIERVLNLIGEFSARADD